VLACRSPWAVRGVDWSRVEAPRGCDSNGLCRPESESNSGGVYR